MYKLASSPAGDSAPLDKSGQVCCPLKRNKEPDVTIADLIRKGESCLVPDRRPFRFGQDLDSHFHINDEVGYARVLLRHVNVVPTGGLPPVIPRLCVQPRTSDYDEEGQ
jgi:hypothetical protein